jgi:uncharacterized membrane protein
MSLTNSDLMTNARTALAGNWGNAVILSVVLFVLLGVISALPVIGVFIYLILGGAFSIGYFSYFIKNMKGENAQVSDLFNGFSNFGNAIVANIAVFIMCCLWALLLFVPGVIAALGYSLTFLLMAEDPKMDGMAAMRKSKEMMDGYKGQLFCLLCRFIGWMLLGMLAFGIGIFWVMPYMAASLTEFYFDVKTAHESRKTASAETA